MSTIEACYIYDEHNALLVDHVYTGRPPPSQTVLPLYLEHPTPRPSLIYLPTTNPPTLLFSIIQDNLLFLAPCSSDIEPLLVLEFLHRLADSLEEFLGSPLLSTKIAANYDIVAQVLAEIADAGIISQGEPNVLRDLVETGPGVLKNLLGGVGLPGSSPALQSGSSVTFQRPALQPALSAQGSAIPWRRSNVRHTSNEMYVDIVESLAVTLAPSGRPLSAFAYGSIAFTCKVSGVPDLLLNLSTGGKGAGMGNRGDQLRSLMERAVFHPCVRLNRWLTEGVLSFVPPDGRFALCGYETDLLGPEVDLSASKSTSNVLNLPATIEISVGLGSSGNEFELRLLQPQSSASSARSAAAASLQSNLGRQGPFKSGAVGDSKSPSFEELSVRVPIPSAVRNVADIRPSKGEAHWTPVDGVVEWKLSGKDFDFGRAVLRCTVQGPISDEDEQHSGHIMNGMTATTYDYDDDQPAIEKAEKESSSLGAANGADTPQTRMERNKEYMPTSATLSFSIKGWLASGLKVDSLVLDTKKSKGLGSDVRPYKGVKYLTVSKDGIEVRC